MPVVGIDQCIRNLEAKGWDAWEEVSNAFWQEGQEIIREAMEIVPVDTGRLRATIPAVSHLEKTNTTATVVIGCGTNYGLYVHENLMARHNPPTQAKFLEVPILQHAPAIPANIIARVSKL